jgi:hypothetical protein
MLTYLLVVLSGGKRSVFINNTGEDCSTQINNAMITFGYGEFRNSRPTEKTRSLC